MQKPVLVFIILQMQVEMKIQPGIFVIPRLFKMMVALVLQTKMLIVKMLMQKLVLVLTILQVKIQILI